MIYTDVIESSPKLKALCELQRRVLSLILVDVWSVQDIPAQLLDFYADVFNLKDDVWLFARDGEEKRVLIVNQLLFAKHKGTPWAIKEVARLLGFGDVEILEMYRGLHYDAEASYDGESFYAPNIENWWEFYIVCHSGQEVARVDKLKKLVQAIIPARCVLSGVIFDNPLTYNAEIDYGGDHYYA